jgi:hypothetical protein
MPCREAKQCRAFLLNGDIKKSLKEACCAGDIRYS